MWNGSAISGGGGSSTLGTSAASPVPASSYSSTTGLLSSASGAVSVSSAGTEVVRINGTGVGIGTTSPIGPINVATNSPNIGLFFDAYASNPNPTMVFRGARGTMASPSASQAGDALGSIVARGYGTTGFSPSSRAAIQYYAAENWTDTAQGEYLVFKTTPTGTTSTAEVVRIDPSGNVGIGTTSPANTLDIGNSGGIHITSGTPSSTSNAIYNNSGTLMWNGSAVSGGAASSISSAGQLQCGGTHCADSTGSTTLQYCPYKGNVKTTATQGDYTIPAACLTATLTSMYVGGVGSSSVAASTLYYIYLWNHSGTWVLDAETTGHATDSSTGIEIMSGDDTKTLVGMIHTDSNAKIMTGGQTHVARDTNTVATWDNRIPTYTRCQFTNDRTETATSYTEVNSENRCYFMSWADTAILSPSQSGYSNTAGGNIVTKVSVDSVGGSAFTYLTVTAPAANKDMLLLGGGMLNPTEGYHFTVLSGAVSTGTTSTYLSGHDTDVFTIQ